MEASALRAPALARRPLATPLLRLRSDEQLMALFRAGSDDAFAAIHDRYRQRLFAYVRQMLAGAPRADAEDVLQDVFVRAYGALRLDGREVNLRAWLYRVAHNRCIDHLRRPVPPPRDVFALSRGPLHDPIELAQRRDDLRRLVADVGRLPEQQRSALLMREIDGLAYSDIAAALDVTVPAVKSLLVRARMGLVEAIEARDADCAGIRADLLSAYDRGVKASGRARRHMRECDGCREYRGALRGMRRSFASLSPAAGLGPLALLAKAVGAGGAGGGAAASAGGAAAACKVAAMVCTAALATGTAVEVERRIGEGAGAAARAADPASPRVAAPRGQPSVVHFTSERAASTPARPAPSRPQRGRGPAAAPDPGAAVVRSAPLPAAASPAETAPAPAEEADGTGGSAAPEEAPVVNHPPEAPATPALPTPVATAEPAAPAPSVTPVQGGPPPEH